MAAGTTTMAPVRRQLPSPCFLLLRGGEPTCPLSLPAFFRWQRRKQGANALSRWRRASCGLRRTLAHLVPPGQLGLLAGSQLAVQVERGRALAACRVRFLLACQAPGGGEPRRARVPLAGGCLLAGGGYRRVVGPGGVLPP